MEENKVLTEELVNEEAVEEVKEHVADTAKEVAEKAIEAAAKKDIFSVILLIVAGIGLLATGGWVVVAIIKLVGFIKKKIAAKKPVREQQDPEVKDEVVEEEKTE